jgi:hypothetical protein
MIPPVTAIPATPIPIFSQPNPAPVGALQPQVKSRFSQVAGSSWKTSAPLTSPDLHAPAVRQIAQSELPGGSTPVTPPPSPSIRDTGNGYPTRIPANYFGPAIGFGNGSASFGIISRFPFGENYSIRPSAVFGSNGTVLRVPITYDFALGDKEPFERNPLITFHAGGGVQFVSGGGTVNGDKFSLLGTIGVDVNLFEGVALLGSFNTNFGDNSGTNVGLGFEF